MPIIDIIAPANAVVGQEVAVEVASAAKAMLLAQWAAQWPSQAGSTVDCSVFVSKNTATWSIVFDAPGTWELYAVVPEA